MSAQDSYLSAFGIDMVVATTQKAINATIKQYIHEFGKGASPTFKAYFMIDDDGNVQMLPNNWIGWMTDTYTNTDPLSVAAWNGTGTKPAGISDIETPLDANYPPFGNKVMGLKYALSFELGFPGGTIPSSDIVQLIDDGQYAIYKLCFQNVTLAVANYNKFFNYGGISSYEVYTQNNSKIYEFTVKVPLKPINDSSNAPDAVAKQAAVLGDAFTMQQLVLDLDNAAWYGEPSITDAPTNSEVYKMLDTVFLPLYAQLMAANGRAVLGFNFIPNVAANEDFAVSHVDLQIDDVQNYTPPSPAVATLDYLCAINGNTPRAAVDFSDSDNYTIKGLPYWSWFDSVPSVHGVIAISPVSLASYYSKALLSYVQSNCYMPATSWVPNKQNTRYICATPTMQAGQTPSIATYNSSGPLLSFSYSSQPPQGYSEHTTLDENDQKVTYTQQLSTSFTLTLDSGANNTMVVTQRLVMFYHVTTDTLDTQGNIVDKTITDTYTLAVDNQGKYAPIVTSVTTDNSKNIDSKGIDNLFSGGFNTVLDEVQSWAKTLAEKNVTDIPANDIQGLIFPGGNAFSINDLFFSDNKDLVGYITYATPAYINN